MPDTSMPENAWNSLQIYEKEGTEESLNEALNLLKCLRDQLDTVREKYWEKRIRAITRRQDELFSSQA